MRGLTPQVVLQVTGGTAVGTLPEDEIAAVTTDSRQAVPGGLFAAIPGERVDGHKFVPSVLEKGAACAIVNHPVDCALPQIVVPDTQAALGAAAAWYRGQFDIPFVGITGSVGKTTAKEMIACVLAQKFNTLKTEKNFNNELGVPFTLFRLRDEHQAAVVEMGISGFGEMTRLTRMVRPDIAVFTIIGDAHLEFLGSREGVLRAKGEILLGMPDDGVVIANGDDPLLSAHDFGKKTVYCGTGANCDVRAEDIASDGLSEMRCVIVSGQRRFSVRIPAFGKHLISAALLASAVGMQLGLTDEQIAAGLASYETVGSRGRVVDTGALLILDDCYNANPTSTASAIESLSAMPGRRVAVLGDMRELGENSAALHEHIGRLAAESGAVVIACGPEAAALAKGAGEGAAYFPDTAELIEALPRLIRRGDSVLVKASHSMGFDTVAEALKKLYTE